MRQCEEAAADGAREEREEAAVRRQRRWWLRGDARRRSKCAFGVTSVSYLGHIISEAGVAMDPAKVQAIHDWPVPRSARAVRGFLGLAGYYRKRRRARDVRRNAERAERAHDDALGAITARD
ncbi:hypothetical protein E2562_004542 [Oryza meyeriana var. granulata]|uniref:Reverse transcriptase/retrotransposon-derived protein RNase H-like domain-containing protein n=1 Tax=Oryza meyeriana var. granulata TaxID=110450 RepID=A0A6G1F3F3_9ORYZ|nr:hypothetical protein E2562_004542 [Oryza meyeriana var. granulata]